MLFDEKILQAYNELYCILELFYHVELEGRMSSNTQCCLKITAKQISRTSNIHSTTPIIPVSDIRRAFAADIHCDNVFSEPEVPSPDWRTEVNSPFSSTIIVIAVSSSGSSNEDGSDNTCVLHIGLSSAQGIRPLRERTYESNIPNDAAIGIREIFRGSFTFREQTVCPVSSSYLACGNRAEVRKRLSLPKE